MEEKESTSITNFLRFFHTQSTSEEPGSIEELSKSTVIKRENNKAKVEDNMEEQTDHNLDSEFFA